mgnify:CR=1 FL=1
MKSDFDADIAMRRARLERLVAVREEAVIERLEALKAEIDTRLDIENIVRRYALPIAGAALLAGFLLGRGVANARPVRREAMQAKPQLAPQNKNTRPPKFLNQVAQAMLDSAKSLALNYASDFAMRKLQEWLKSTSAQKAPQTNALSEPSH